jgi:hypothetical protein
MSSFLKIGAFIAFNFNTYNICIMEVAPEQIVIVEEEVKATGNPFILFILFLLTFVLLYLLPFIGTLYAEKVPKKWIAYWLILLPLTYVLKPILCFCFGPTGSAFLHLVIGAGLLFVSSQEKVINLLPRPICWSKLAILPSNLPPSSTRT